MRLLHCNTTIENKNQAWGYYGTDLFSALYSSKKIPYRDFVRRKNTVRNSTVRNFFRTLPFGTTLFQPIDVKKNSAANFCHCHVKVQIYRPSSLVVEQNFAFISYKTLLAILYTSRVKRENFRGVGKGGRAGFI